MTTFRELTAGKKPRPVATVTIPPWAWASTYDEKQAEDVCAGLRLPAEDDVQTARAEAARVAWELHPKLEDEDNRVDAFNDGCIRWMLACALCDPNDATVAFFDLAEDRVKIAFNTKGVALLWDALEKAYDEVSPIAPMASDEEIAGLSAHVLSRMKGLNASGIARVRRIVGKLVSEVLDG